MPLLYHRALKVLAPLTLRSAPLAFTPVLGDVECIRYRDVPCSSTAAPADTVTRPAAVPKPLLLRTFTVPAVTAVAPV